MMSKRKQNLKTKNIQKKGIKETKLMKFLCTPAKNDTALHASSILPGTSPF